jgi:D-3-phosphoglycerate dehydrogenase
MSSVLGVTESIDIEPPTTGMARRVSSSLGLSTSPTGTFHTPPWTKSSTHHSRVNTAAFTKQLKPFATEDIKILLLENVNTTGRDVLEAQGYQVTFLKSSLPEDELIERIRWVTH